MCLISIAPKGKDKYSEFFIDGLKSGACSNTHGMGYTYKKNGNNKDVFISKGFFNIEALLSSIKDANLGVDDELMVHQRISTGGQINDVNCHPFVISDKQDEILTVEGWVKKPTLVHNGIFRDYSYKKSVYSDTYHFVHEFMSNKYLLEFFKEDQEEFNILFGNIGFMSWNKIAILFPDKGIVISDGFILDEGYLFSNGGYCNSKIRNVGGVETESIERTKFVAALPKDTLEEETKKKEAANTNIVNVPRLIQQSTHNEGKGFLDSLRNILTKVYEPSPGPKQPGLFISVNKHNHNQLLFILKNDFNIFKKDDVLEAVKFTSSLEIYVKKLKDDKVIASLFAVDLMKHCDIYPKQLFAKKFSEYRKMVEDIKAPGRNFTKKITKIVTTSKKERLQISNYGTYDREAVIEYMNQLDYGFKPYEKHAIIIPVNSN